ncbi:MAG: nickel pincer cofactor biosynthesis protein LarC [Candidatus Aminicenantia bacterium]
MQENKFIYFDCLAGISGDMILGALIDLGISPVEFDQEIKKLSLPVEIKIYKVKRASLQGTKVDVKTAKNQIKPRKLADIQEIIEKSKFSKRVKETSLSIFKNLYNAESKVHGLPINQIHLHEAGADDALVDVLGCCLLLEKLEVKTIYSSPLNLGQGWIKVSHGILPVPPPAVGELLKNVPVYSAWVKEELVTPTGAAIISTLAKTFDSFPEMKYEKIGYGAGTKDFPDFPNLLRAFYGKKELIGKKEHVLAIETNIDDVSPQLLGYFFDQAFQLGALDVFLTPIVMKKNRLATKLTILANADKINNLIEAIFRETTSIGVRYFPVERVVLERKIEKVKVLNQEIKIKVAYFNDQEINIQPEFSDCEEVARKTKKSMKEIYQLAISQYLSGKQGLKIKS